MPPEFRYQGNTDIWLPAERGEFTQGRTTHFLRVIGRLAPGRSIDDARRDMNAVARQVQIDAPESAAVGVFMIPMQEQLVGDTRRPLYLLLGAASLLLLIGCTNVASTLLAQGSERQREIAIRTSLGAGRGRIVRQLLTESVLLAALGAAAGLAMATGNPHAHRHDSPRHRRRDLRRVGRGHHGVAVRTLAGVAGLRS
jgi:putative ABC transport system permease protein